MALITKGGTAQIRTNFNESELQSGSWNGIYTDAPDSFELSDISLDGLQAIRTHYGIEVFVNSTGRSPYHNTAVGGSKGSFHLFDILDLDVEAIDWRFKDQNIEGSAGYNASIDYYTQVKNKKGILYEKLVSIGIKGFGLYDSFNHIDSRTYLAHWDNSTKKKSYIEAITSTYTNNEDGFLDWKKSITTTSIIVLIIIAVLIWWFKFRK